MNKKLFTILCIAVFLIATVGFISAANETNDNIDSKNDDIKLSSSEDKTVTSNLKDIKVKIVWDDAAKSGDRPTQVKVKLLKDDVVVDTIVLNEANSWNATFKNQSADGNYKVQMEKDLEGYDTSISGNSDTGFVIKNKVADNKLGVSQNESDLKDSNSSSDANASSDVANSTDVTNDTKNATDVANSTDVTNDTKNATDVANDTKNATDANVTNNTNNNVIVTNNTNITNNTVVVNNTNNTNNTVPVNQTVKKEQKDTKPPKKENNNQKLQKVGIPIAILVLVIIVIVVVTFSRRRNN